MASARRRNDGPEEDLDDAISGENLLRRVPGGPCCCMEANGELLR